MTLTQSQAIPDVKDLLRRLSPFKCALLSSAPRHGLSQEERERRVYTPRTLRWHDNRHTGIYTAIGSDVYDITSKWQLPVSYTTHMLHTDICLIKRILIYILVVVQP